MKPLRIIISVNGNTKIGFGHVYRIINLVRVLKKYKNNITFLTMTPMARKILSKYSKCLLLKNNSYLQAKKIIQQLNPDVIVIDKHNESSQLLKIFHKNCKNIIAIDYTGKNKHLVKVGINILYPISGTRTKNSFSNLRYSILNKSFINTKPIMVKKKVNSIIVLQGGSDDHCFTPKIINSLNLLEEKFKVSVIIGPAFNCWSRLNQALQKNKKRLKILNSVNNMSLVMAKHDMAISGGGMTLLELCRLGVPSIVVCTSKLENETGNLLQKKGFGVNLGFDTNLSKNKIAVATKQLLLNYSKRKRMNLLGKKIIDGLGTERVALLVTKLGVN